MLCLFLQRFESARHLADETLGRWIVVRERACKSAAQRTVLPFHKLLPLSCQAETRTRQREIRLRLVAAHSELKNLDPQNLCPLYRVRLSLSQTPQAPEAPFRTAPSSS